MEKYRNEHSLSFVKALFMKINWYLAIVLDTQGLTIHTTGMYVLWIKLKNGRRLIDISLILLYEIPSMVYKSVWFY